ncbi:MULTISPECIES: cell wall metabolism sensor histidine kinase WalK [unclassified Enterococcus]|uniref:cell wall metabolism sensor histidine kinase WalK n=1 Tax=unclassified Enterococcus TaxID=2608891 RepID=UPI001554EC78|nr:cell wall metabolism sensor histidine kinase WalK [Enterococcus sp. MMGLQ5-2]MBS7585124.1 cell wall metabolism sensor histidine kinase WalK [Enterococcus sp. MMGLQ5-1]NPD12980.1 cell wall metabolism sensor histidine kinase WalK [Enterococcus sp. MMGLQ5-1]NPD37694.1 cell wall metabolism sensor histidine kinase WalK [Enterococcus sp. MMGLQ5-2]
MVKKKKWAFWKSINFKITISFLLILLVSIEIIGNIFIQNLEQTTISDYKETVNNRVSQLATSAGDIFSDMTETDDQKNEVLQNQLESFNASDILEARIVDSKEVIRAAVGSSNDELIGKKNDYLDLIDFTLKRKEIVEDGRQVYVNVQPIQNSTGDSVLGAIYVKSDISQQYNRVQDIATIFYSASLVAGLISVIVALLFARSITKPIKEMEKQAFKIAYGDYSSKIKVVGEDELSELGTTFNLLSNRIERTQDTMESEQNKLNNVLTYMTDGVIATDRRGKVVLINQPALDQLNMARSDVIGTSILQLFELEKEYTMRDLLENRPEIVIDRVDANEDFISLKSDFALLRRESGFISGLVAVLHDVTEQEKNERERRNFVSNVSHELRTPLTSVKSYLEALQDGAWRDSKIAPEFIDVSLEETNRMIRMINDLLNLSRMDDGNVHLDLEIVNFVNLVEFVLNRFDQMMNNDSDLKKYIIERDFQLETAWVEVDTDKMTQVIDNVINNAIKYSPDGGVITVVLKTVQHQVILSVTDEGMGIPRKDLGKIFDRFYRVDKARARKQGGTGLGLAIAREVMKAHGGYIWAKSQEGEGSTFTLVLPEQEDFEVEEWD